MSLSGRCKLLKIYLNEDSRYKSHNLYHALLLKFKESGIAGVTVSRGIEGYGQGKKLHTMKILELSSSLPIIVEVVDTEENIKKAEIIAKEMVNEGLILTADVEVIKNGE
jgi:PII-like signaling protein